MSAPHTFDQSISKHWLVDHQGEAPKVTLLGHVPRLQGRWHAWLDQQAFSYLAFDAVPTPHTLLSEWLKHLMVRRDLMMALASVLAPWTGWNAAKVAITLRDGTRQERRTLFAACANTPLPDKVTAQAAAYLPALVLPWDALLAALCKVPPVSTQIAVAEYAVMEAWALILGFHEVPVVSLVASGPTLQEAPIWAESLGRQAPHVGLAVIADADSFKELMQRPSRGRGHAFMSQNALMPPLTAAASSALQHAPLLREDGARSEAERRLFDALEADLDTHGLFHLNKKMPFRFGHRMAEIDLYCAALKLAIEVDGYHHFRSPDDYRRDRRKDWELQRQGIIVLRFLDVDVLHVGDAVMQTIKAAVEQRKEIFNHA